MIQLMQYVEATHKMVVSKLQEELWRACDKTLVEKVPIMTAIIPQVEKYLQTIVKKKEFLENDS